MEEQTQNTQPVVIATPDKEFKQRANSAYSFAIKDGRLVWNFPNIGTLVLDPAKVSAVNRARAINHGLKQRVIDGAALDADASGKVDPKAKYAEMQRIIEHLESGTDDWNLKPSAGTTGPASYVTRALVEMGTYVVNLAVFGEKGAEKVDVSTTEKANAFVKRLAESPNLKLKGEMGKARTWLETNSKKIREKIAEIRAAETPVVDVDAEIEELMADEQPSDEPGEAPAE